MELDLPTLVPITSSAPLATDGERPLCECHREPMTTNGVGWRCTIKHRETNRRSRELNREKDLARKRLYRLTSPEKVRETQARWLEKKREAGLCMNCGREPVLSETFCWGCLNKKGVLGCQESQITQAETQVTQLVALSE